jgi:predicted dehydrogenase
MTQKSPLKLAVIGGGINSAVGTTHRIAATMDGRWQIGAGCFSTHRDVNLMTAQQAGVPEDRTYSQWQELLEREKGRSDAVVVLTPTPLHKDMVIAALEQGHAVICEKALAGSSGEAQQIKSVADKMNGFLAVAYNYTGYPMLRELKRMIESGRMGRLQQVHVEMPQEGYTRLNRQNEPNVPQPWRLQDVDVPTISLDLGVHLHHLVYFLSGQKPLEVVATQNTFGFFGVVDNVMGIARYTDDLMCQIWYSKCALGHRNGLRVRVYGELGAAEWYQMEPETLSYYDKKGNVATIDRTSLDSTISTELRYSRFKAGHPSGFIEAYANHYYDIAESLLAFQEGRPCTSPWVFNAELAEEGLKLCEAISASAKEQCWRKIE